MKTAPVNIVKMLTRVKMYNTILSLEIGRVELEVLVILLDFL